MDLMQEIIANAKANKQRIVLPEGDEPRTLKAADQLLADGVADITLIGPADKIKEMTAEFGLKNIDKAQIIDPKNNPDKQQYAELLYELRKAKGMTMEQAEARTRWRLERQPLPRQRAGRDIKARHVTM